MKKVKLVEDFEPRLYQQSIFGKCLDKNSLVVLPTGLGKTVIALMLLKYYFDKSNKKILFLAPTKPLVEQQKKSFEGFILNSDDFNFQVLTGLVGPKKRLDLYKQNDFIFSTPQLIENDLINEIIDYRDFCFVVFDEAHRASGAYAYNFIANEFNKGSCKFLALSASPGTSKEEIKNIIQNLKIENLDVRTYDDFDVKDYVNKTKLESCEVELPNEFVSISKLLNNSYSKRVEFLKELGFLKGKPSSVVTRKDLLDLQTYLRVTISQGDAKEEIWKAISISAALMKLGYGIELFESQEVSAAYSYFHNFFRGDSSKAAQELLVDVDFREAFDRISNLKKNGVLHPKLHKLKEIVLSKIRQNSDLKILIFNQYRETSMKLVSELNLIKEINASIFVGQAKKGDVKMSQKEQKKVLEDFRNGEFNVLVSTSVGEEGLDIPKVDLVIFYEPVSSAIRTIQRVGRTGRFRKGEAYVLQAKGTRDIITKHIANAKEKRMYKALNEIIDEFQIEGEKKKVGLGKFMNEHTGDNCDTDSSKKDGDIKSEIDSRIEIFIDQRENASLIKELYKLSEIKVTSKQLNVGDIIITENIGIERKAKLDFVNSIIDKRLFPQLLDLARNFKRPVLIIEGPENIFSLRNVNPNVIRATLSSIAIDLRIPIIYTDSMEETAQMIQTIAKRTIRVKKEISLASDKRAFSENEELEKVVSNIPRVNVVSAKSLLNHFKTVKDLANASEKKLLECEGVGKLRAKLIKEFFEREYKLL